MSFNRPDIFRPPSEWDSYYLPLTGGCSNNTCTFCTYYGTKLQIRDEQEVTKEIDALCLYGKHRMKTAGIHPVVYMLAGQWNGKKVFLQDGDALVYPYPKLVNVLEYLNNKFPCIERIASYATPQDVLRRSVAELKRLKELKLGILYIGIETGDEALLRAIGKDLTYQQMVEAGRKVKEAGILSSVTVILGLGGVEGSQKHALETAKILTEIDPDYAGALTMTFVPETPLCNALEQGTFHPISPFQSLEELRTMIAGSNFTNCFFSSMHASNYLSIRGTLPADKNRMLKELDRVIARKDESLLKPEFLRGL